MSIFELLFSLWSLLAIFGLFGFIFTKIISF